jgi:hypothetical protein
MHFLTAYIAIEVLHVEIKQKQEKHNSRCFMAFAFLPAWRQTGAPV